MYNLQVQKIMNNNTWKLRQIIRVKSSRGPIGKNEKILNIDIKSSMYVNYFKAI